MAYSQANLTAIQSAIAKGELSVEYDGRKVIYRSMDDLLKAEQHIANAIATAASPRSRQSFGYTRKGFY